MPKIPFSFFPFLPRLIFDEILSIAFWRFIFFIFHVCFFGFFPPGFHQPVFILFYRSNWLMTLLHWGVAEGKKGCLRKYIANIHIYSHNEQIIFCLHIVFDRECLLTRWCAVWSRVSSMWAWSVLWSYCIWLPLWYQSYLRQRFSRLPTTPQRTILLQHKCLLMLK